MNKEDIAKVAHAAQYAYEHVLGNVDIIMWDDLTRDRRLGLVAGVEYVMNVPGTTPEGQHQAWCKHKKDNGWLLGTEVNEKLKTHNLLIPFDKLPRAKQVKDALFISTVLALLPMQDEIGMVLK